MTSSSECARVVNSINSDTSGTSFSPLTFEPTTERPSVSFSTQAVNPVSDKSGNYKQSGDMLKPRLDDAMEVRVFQTSCERCRRRKIKCDRSQPCSKCSKANATCVPIGTGEKQRPVSRGYVQALEGQIASLEKFITKLIAVDASKRDEMLANFSTSSGHLRTQPTQDIQATELPAEQASDSIPIRSRSGQLRKLRDGKAAEFYGATSFFQISPSDDQEAASDILSASLSPASNSVHNAVPTTLEAADDSPYTAFSPYSDMCRHLIATFFQTQYQYHMCLYREYFLRDFDAGFGPYYSDLLMYAICAMGALASEEVALRELSDVFFNRAQELLYGSALESPNLTTLQALILLGHREIGHGKTSKGWLFSGMAFRLAHEMGLHLDPNNWNGSDDSRIEREILRRTYWAAFVADKQLSLYFGRPPALYPGESDVRDTIRIPYPPEWRSLLNTYIMDGTSETAYEDGFALVAAFVQQVELCKILHRMITEVFENRNAKTDETILATSVREIHVSLTKWLADLPAKLHWNQWFVGAVPPLVLHLHMLYHTAMIILHRPPRQLFKDAKTRISKDLEICCESLDSIIKLLRIYSRHYQYSPLPLTFVHILATTASVILMKRYISDLPWDDVAISRPLDHVLEAIEGISHTWPCAKQVQGVIDATIAKSNKDDTRNDSPESFDFMAGLAENATFNPLNLDMDFEMDDTNVGLFDLDQFLNDESQWDDNLLEPVIWEPGDLLKPSLESDSVT